MPVLCFSMHGLLPSWRSPHLLSSTAQSMHTTVVCTAYCCTIHNVVLRSILSYRYYRTVVLYYCSSQTEVLPSVNRIVFGDRCLQISCDGHHLATSVRANYPSNRRSLHYSRSHRAIMPSYDTCEKKKSQPLYCLNCLNSTVKLNY